jgi:hypothetical protein
MELGLHLIKLIKYSIASGEPNRFAAINPVGLAWDWRSLRQLCSSMAEPFLSRADWVKEAVLAFAYLSVPPAVIHLQVIPEIAKDDQVND